MRLYLISPGENDGETLTNKGTWEIKNLARKLKYDKLGADVIYSNGHLISTQTAKLLSRSLSIPFVSDERFTELDDNVIDGKINENDAENLYYINLFIDEVISRKKDAIVTIGDSIHRHIISRLTGMPLKVTKHFSLSPSSISLINLDKNGSTENWRIGYINDTNHLKLP